MKNLVDFLVLNPIWTRRRLEIVWIVYLVATLMMLGLTASALPASTTLRTGFPIVLVYSTLFTLAHLALVRIFLELALKFLVADKERA